jgi:predicted secreted protein
MVDFEMFYARLPKPLHGLLAAIATIITAAVSFAADPTPVTVSEAQSGSTVRLSKGKTLIVRLPAQLGTGFSWGITQVKGAPVRLASSQTESQSAGSPGASETQIFTFEATDRGAGEIELGYRQPWMKDQAPSRNFTLHVVVSNQVSQ